MTENELREKVVATARSYLGAKQGSAFHKKIIDTFNKVKPDGWAMTYTAYWCAAFASAVPILAFGVDTAKKYFPLSANCPNIIVKAKKMGIWVEQDSYKAKIGDFVLYDWQDTTGSKADNVGSPDHIGIIEKVNAKTFVVIEGNKNKAVGERTLNINGKYIRGFVTPKYSAMATKPKKKTVAQIAQEVIDGKWGNGDERKAKLKAAGYDYDAVQKKVNELMKKKTETKKTDKKKTTAKKTETKKKTTAKKRPTGKQMVDFARKELGNDYKKYCKAFGKYTSWCEIFIWWLFTQKGMPIKKTSFARYAAKWFAERYEHVSMADAKAGDVVFFTNTNKGNNKMHGKVSHVGLIRGKGKKETKGKNKGKVVTCITIEGNVNGKGNWKKSKVACKTRKMSYVWGIFRPKYSDPKK